MLIIVFIIVFLHFALISLATTFAVYAYKKNKGKQEKQTPSEIANIPDRINNLEFLSYMNMYGKDLTKWR